MPNALATAVKSPASANRDNTKFPALVEDNQKVAALHIAIDGTALYGVFGGVEYSLWNLLRALNALDSPHQFTVFIPHDGPPDEHLADFGAHWNWRRLPFRGAAKMRRIFWQQFEWPRALSEFDLLHAPTYVAPLHSPVPVVLGVYDLIALTHPQFATRTNRLHYGFVLPRALRRAAHIIVPSHAVRREVEDFAPGKNISVVPLGVEAEFHEEANASDIAQCRRRHGLPDDYFFFAGNFEPKKNIAALLRAQALLCELVPDAPPLVLAGGARRWDGHEVIADGKRVRWLGHVPRHDLPLLYAGCRAFVFPTLAEGFCLPVLEALAVGTPVVTTRAVPLPQIESVTRLCEPHDIKSIAGAMQWMLQNPAEAEKMRRAGRIYAADFTWERAAQQTLTIYQNVAQNIQNSR